MNLRAARQRRNRPTPSKALAARLASLAFAAWCAGAAATPCAAQPSAEPNASPSTQPADAAPETPFGAVQFSGLVQGWLTVGTGTTVDSFRVRRAELKLTGDVTAKVRWTVMIDAAKALSMNTRTELIDGTPVTTDAGVNQASRMLQDASVTLSYFKYAQIEVGQFKLPLSLEGLQSSATLETVERALFASDRARGGYFGDVRDVGMRISGPITPYLDYVAGVFNGTGQSQGDVDRDGRKAVAGRVTARPPQVAGLQWGASAAWDRESTTAAGHSRYGADVRYVRGALLLKSEYMAGRDLATPRRGFYVLAGYNVTSAIQPVFRFDTWDPDTTSDRAPTAVLERDYLAGVNVLLTGHQAKWQVNYVFKTFRHPFPNRHVVASNVQASW